MTKKYIVGWVPGRRVSIGSGSLGSSLTGSFTAVTLSGAGTTGIYLQREEQQVVVILSLTVMSAKQEYFMRIQYCITVRQLLKVSTITLPIGQQLILSLFLNEYLLLKTKLVRTECELEPCKENLVNRRRILWCVLLQEPAQVRSFSLTKPVQGQKSKYGKIRETSAIFYFI